MIDPSCTDEEVKSLVTAIFHRYGLDFSGYEPKSFRRRLYRIMRLHDLPSTADLWIRILREPEFIHEFVNQLSVGLTAMFRDPFMWAALKLRLQEIKPTSRPLRIWHAGCSTGEEVYSMAILLREINWSGRVEVWATDMNQSALNVGENGHYPKMMLDQYAKHYTEYRPGGTLASYYTETGTGGQMDRSLVRNVRWVRHNLVTDPYPGQFDIIFCRNVMIYFDVPTKERLIPNFYNALRPGGLFIIGYFDALVPLLERNEFMHLDRSTKLFQRTPED